MHFRCIVRRLYFPPKAGELRFNNVGRSHGEAGLHREHRRPRHPDRRCPQRRRPGQYRRQHRLLLSVRFRSNHDLYTAVVAAASPGLGRRNYPVSCRMLSGPTCKWPRWGLGSVREKAWGWSREMHELPEQAEDHARPPGRRRWRWAASGLAVVLALVAAATVLQSPAFQLQRVDVSGNETVSADEIRHLLGVAPGALRWRHPVGELRSRLLLLQPWLKDARITWGAGGVLTVAVTERRPLALLPYYNLYAALDGDGVILDVGRLTDFRVPVISGVPLPKGLRGEQVRHPFLAGALQLLALLPGNLVPDEVAVSPAGDLTLTYSGPVAVLLGPPERLADKVAALAAVDPDARRPLLDLARQQRKVLDLRNPARPTFGNPH